MEYMIAASTIATMKRNNTFVLGEAVTNFSNPSFTFFFTLFLIKI